MAGMNDGLMALEAPHVNQTWLLAAALNVRCPVDTRAAMRKGCSLLCPACGQGLVVRLAGAHGCWAKCRLNPNPLPLCAGPGGAGGGRAHGCRAEYCLIKTLNPTSHAQGLVVLVVGAWLPGWTPGPDDDSAKWFQSGALFAALYIVALGTGGIKPNVSAFGADQLDVTDPQVHPSVRLRMYAVHTLFTLYRASSGG